MSGPSISWNQCLKILLNLLMKKKLKLNLSLYTLHVLMCDTYNFFSFGCNCLHMWNDWNSCNRSASIVLCCDFILGFLVLGDLPIFKSIIWLKSPPQIIFPSWNFFRLVKIFSKKLIWHMLGAYKHTNMLFLGLLVFSWWK